VTRFSFIAYGDNRCDCRLPSNGGGPPVIGRELQPEHDRLVQAMLDRIESLAGTDYPVRFVVSAGDAVFQGYEAERWDVYIPLIERLTVGANMPFFFTVGNHDVTTAADAGPTGVTGLANALAAMSKLTPPDDSPRRLKGHSTYAFGYGHAFFIAIDSTIPRDAEQLAWVTRQLEQLDRARFRHVFAFFHHPPFTSGRYAGSMAWMRTVYQGMFRKHHVRMTIAGHDHLFDHFVERYAEQGTAYRMDHVVTAGGGAPSYAYTGEPNVAAYLAEGASQGVTLEHVARPGPTPADNPHHFVVVQVDGDRLSLEVVSTGPTALRPYNGTSRIDLNDPPDR
jgi:hypothetical protein